MAKNEVVNENTPVQEAANQGIRATFDTTTLEGSIKVFNAQAGASISLKTLSDGEIIEADGVLQYEDMVDSYGTPKLQTITVIFGKDGKTYAGISDTVADAGAKLIEVINRLGLKEFKVGIIKLTSGKGNEFLNIRLAL